VTLTSPRRAALLFTAAALAVSVGAGRRLRTVRAHSAEVPSADEDSRQYYAAARNFTLAGVFSAAPPDEPGPKPPATLRAAMYPAYLALALGDGSAGPAPAWRANLLASIAALALTGAAGLALGSPLAAAAALGLVALDPKQLETLWTLDVQAFFTVLVLGLALALLLWARRPTLKASAAAGFIMGASLCCRSTLILFPFFWALVLWHLRDRVKRPLAQALVFAACAALAALPWALRNRRVTGHFQILEKQTAGYVLAAGSMGVVSNDFAMETASGDAPARSDVYRGLSDGSPRGTLSELAWAAARTAAHPGVYALSCLLRFVNLWGYWLLLWPCLIYELRRRDAGLDRWALAAIPLYWNIHVFILSSHRHAAPATPLLSLAVGLVAARALGEPNPPDRRAPAPALAALLLPPLMLWVWTVRDLRVESRRLPEHAAAAALRLERASSAADAGRGDEALTLLADAERFGPGAYQREDIARLYQRLGRPARCAELFESLCAEFPRDAALRNDAAICDELDGNARRALDQAEAAVGLDPRFLPAYLTLASLRLDVKDKKGALRAYEAALALSPGGLDPVLRQEISRERGRLRELSAER
jgi:tetratricopeptide (TPR) repeat protein